MELINKLTKERNLSKLTEIEEIKYKIDLLNAYYLGKHDGAMRSLELITKRTENGSQDRDDKTNE